MRIPKILPLLAGVGLLAGCQDQELVAPDNEWPAPLFNASGEHKAIVIHKGETSWCGMLDGNGNFVGPFESTNIITRSKNGNAQHICHASGVANPTGKAIVWKARDFPGEACGIWNGEGDAHPNGIFDPDNFLFTLHWIQIISASGQATLTCHYKDG